MRAKKLIGMLLTFAMAVSLLLTMSLNVFAEDPQPEPYDGPDVGAGAYTDTGSVSAGSGDGADVSDPQLGSAPMNGYQRVDPETGLQSGNEGVMIDFDGTITVSQDVTIKGRPGQSAILIARGRNVTIEIKADVTLDVRGGDADGMTGAGAGIEVPEGSSLTVIGLGKLLAVGGGAAVGGRGENGQDGRVDRAKEWCYSGAGGRGGNGGGGAGAGIGGRGGSGGLGGEGGKGVESRAASSYVAMVSGKPGAQGGSGSAGNACGGVTISKTVKLDVTGGSASAVQTSGGNFGQTGIQRWYFIYGGWGGGGGGAGGNGCSGAQIGTGGSGGGGGGGGGSGIIDYWALTVDFERCIGTGLGGEGGKGAVEGEKGNDMGPSRDTGKPPHAPVAGNGGAGGNAAGGSGVQAPVRYLEVVGVPKARQGLVFNGKLQSGIPEEYGYYTRGNMHDAAGTYTCRVTLRDGYCWSDGTLTVKSIEWSIAKKPVILPPGRLHYSGYELTAYKETDTYSVEGGKGTEIGAYTAKLKLKEPRNYKWENSDAETIEVHFDIHRYEDVNHLGRCDHCGGTDRHYYNVITYLDRIVTDYNTVRTEEKTCAIARTVLADDTEWVTGTTSEKIWYVVDENVSLNNRPVVKGNIGLILMNGKTLTANKGITVEDGNSLSIYSQSDDKNTMGALNAGTSGVTAIGGSVGGRNGRYSGGNGGNCGSVFIHGGNIKLEAEDAPCIGGGNGNDALDLDLTRDPHGNPGRGGDGGNGGNVYIYDGNIFLKASGTACIGGGNGGDGGDNYFVTNMSRRYGGDGGNGGASGRVSLYGGNTTLITDSLLCIGGGTGGVGGEARFRYRWDVPIPGHNGKDGSNGALTNRHRNIFGSPVIKERVGFLSVVYRNEYVEEEKKIVIITVGDKNAYVGDAVPQLGAGDYTVSGLVDGDTLLIVPTLSYESEPDMSKSGSVKIVAAGADAGSDYEIIYFPGKLTVSSKPALIDEAPATIEDAEYVMPILDVSAGYVMPYMDVSIGDYFYDAVEWADQNDITDGVDAQHFAPDAPVTRAQVVTFLWRAAGCPMVNYAMNVTDVEGKYYTEAVRWALAEGITKGTSETTFSPDMICTRGQIVAFLARFAGVQDAQTESVFADVQPTDFFAAAVRWAKDNGVTAGTSDTTFGPNEACTRAQVVTFLYRWMVR